MTSSYPAGDNGKTYTSTSHIEAGTGKRAKRLCVSRKTSLPSATHYVGYVEDEETPEMIMKKFEELDRVVAVSQQHATPRFVSSSLTCETGAVESTLQHPQLTCMSSNASLMGFSSAALPTSGPHPQPSLGTCDPSSARSEPPDSPLKHISKHDLSYINTSQDRNNHLMGLSEEALLAVFKATSTFSVRAAMDNNEILHATAHDQRHYQKHHPNSSTSNPIPHWLTQHRQTLMSSGRLTSSSDSSGNPPSRHHRKGSTAGNSTDGEEIDDDYVEYLSGFWSDGEADKPKHHKEQRSRKPGFRKHGVTTDAAGGAVKHEKPPKPPGGFSQDSVWGLNVGCIVTAHELVVKAHEQV